ncbi:hypothetical protein K2173_011001 [Erythroxylum novogranatense]|uniref:Arginine/serine-rich coiled-coil protein 2 n=1 Tax=Erythroxylum novogranatense TaxID=1862640 RepID=A0AAV8T1K4_9ROSI|nr:hypothetical protein K2173_011001 [Erythroxylum novogranatense]
MEPNTQSLPPDDAEVKTTFRKPSGDVSTRNYRRHSPVHGSSSSDGSPKRQRSSSPLSLRGDLAGSPEYRQRRKDDERELDKEPSRNQFGRSGDSHRHSDRHSSRNSHGYSRHDDRSRYEKRVDDERRHYQSSSHSGRDSRGSTYPSRSESDYGRTRDYVRNADKYARDRYDTSGYRGKDREKESSYSERQKLKDKDISPDRGGSGKKHTDSISEEKDRDRHRWDRDIGDDKRDYYRSSRDQKSDRALYNEESRGYKNDSYGKDSNGHRSIESHKNDPKELHGQRERKTYEDCGTNKEKDRYNRATLAEDEIKIDFGHEQEPVVKKSKLSSSCKDDDYREDVANEKKSSSSTCPISANISEAADDLNAAKVAAMKAAELVNKNLTGAGFMSTEQKKKLLWGNKKSTTPEEQSGHRWETSMIGDRERQEKFNKLMSLRLPWYIWPIVGCERQCQGGSAIRRPSSSGEAKRTSDGFREAVHCWTPAQRWSHSWIGSLNGCLNCLLYCKTLCNDNMLYTCGQLWTCAISESCFLQESMLSLHSCDILAEFCQLQENELCPEPEMHLHAYLLVENENCDAWQTILPSYIILHVSFFHFSVVKR